MDGVLFQGYPANSLKFTDNLVIETNNEQIVETYDYILKYVNKVPFLEIRKDKNLIKNCLILFEYDKFYKLGGLFLYSIETKVPEEYWGRESLFFLREDSLYYAAGSELSENGIIYSVKNLGSINKHIPWASKGASLGQYIIIGEKKPKLNPRHFYEIKISNGYVSDEKPFLFEDNSRMKKILITDLNGLFECSINIIDTPNIQSIDLPFPTTGIKIEILDVFLGKKYKDVCINFIIPIMGYIRTPRQ